MVEIKLPCEIGMRVKYKYEDTEYRVLGYEIIGSANPLNTSYRAMADAVEINDDGHRILISSKDGVFPDCIEIIGF